MFEFNKVMKDYESLNAIERGLMLTEKSVSILAKLSALDIDGIDPVETLASLRTANCMRKNICSFIPRS